MSYEQSVFLWNKLYMFILTPKTQIIHNIKKDSVVVSSKERPSATFDVISLFAVTDQKIKQIRIPKKYYHTEWVKRHNNTEGIVIGLVWFYGISAIIGYIMPNPVYTYISSSSSSSCRAESTNIPDPLYPRLPINHRLWQVFRVTSRIIT